MGYCYYLYAPNLSLITSGRFVACEKYFLSNNSLVDNIPSIGYYENYGFGRYLNLENMVFILNEDQCKEADEYTETTFFTDIIKKYNCSGMIIRVG